MSNKKTKDKRKKQTKDKEDEKHIFSCHNIKRCHVKMDAKDTGCHLCTSLSEDGHLNIGTYKQGKQLLNPFWHEKPIPKELFVIA